MLRLGGLTGIQVNLWRVCESFWFRFFFATVAGTLNTKEL